MKIISLVLISLVFCTNIYSQTSTKYVGSQIYESGQFVQKDFYVVNGIFKFSKPEKVDTIINLQYKFVIPPFGDAHTHNLDRPWQIGFMPKKYAREGTIYVLNLTSKLDGVKKVQKYFQSDSTIDVSYSLQGLTSTLGHPFMAYEPFSMGLNYNDWKENIDSIRTSRIDENNSYIFLDNEKDIEKKLPEFFNEKPDVVKIYLLHSEEYSERYENTELGDGGLSIEVAKKVIEEAHHKNLKVYAHIETAHDFEQAILAGVDYFAHMPGYGWDTKSDAKSIYYVKDSIIDLAVKNKVGIIPTIKPALDYAGQDSIQKSEFIKDFLTRYNKKGGKILIGSDIFNETLLPEIESFIRIGIFEPRELLNILCYETPRTIFPKRKIGVIEEGYEGSFLVLDNNPLIDPTSLLEVKMTVKEGVVIE